MADVLISELPAASSVSATDVFPVSQGATTRKATLAQALSLNIDVTNSAPVVALTETGVAANSGRWRLQADAQRLKLESLTDAGVAWDIFGADRTVGDLGKIQLLSLKTAGTASGPLGAASTETLTMGGNDLTFIVSGDLDGLVYLQNTSSSPNALMNIQIANDSTAALSFGVLSSTATINPNVFSNGPSTSTPYIVGTSATGTLSIGSDDKECVRLFNTGHTMFRTNISTLESASAPAIATAGTITTALTGVARLAPAAAVTGIIMQAGTLAGQKVTVINQSAAANTVTMAVSGTSNVANGVSCVIAGLTAKNFTWNSVTSLWYPES